MNAYQNSLINEHSQLVIRIQNLHNYVYSDASDNDDKIEFANKCIQLTSMKKYEEAIRARMENTGITFENGNYFERIASIQPVVAVVSATEQTDDKVVSATEQTEDGN